MSMLKQQSAPAQFVEECAPGDPEPERVTPDTGMDEILAPLHDSCFNEGDAVTGWLLEWFSPFNELTDTQREIIAGYETIRKAAGGTRLIEQGSRNDICIYLVEGSLTLTGPDEGTMVIRAGTRRSRLPISVLTPHVYGVTAATDVSVIVFSQQLVRRIIEISTTYTSTGPGRYAEASTAAISNGAQALYLNRTYRLTSK
ncbi:MAG: cyclic nucleotide-binding domain-containing protein [Gammaproteobacteria bacterium]|nr:cyclic nucleotide-binding domain-containing protein [Gammaproteobacteria bacterium]